MNRKEITVYRTHITIYPYQRGENRELEKMFSKWNIIFHRYEPIAYIILNGTLYIPRIRDISIIENMFNSQAIIETDWDISTTTKKYKVVYDTRGQIQEDSVDFLDGNGRFNYTNKSPQLGLNLDTGDGKTFCTVSSIIHSRVRAIIILPKSAIKDQWIKTFVEMTDVPEDKILNIESADTVKDIIKSKKTIPYDYYTINHQLITSIGQKHGWDLITRFFNKIEVGIKVFDECHSFFADTLRIDFFTNTRKSIYLTATFTRSDYRENSIYQLAYSNMIRFGEETKDYAEKRKHTVVIPIMYNSYASQIDNFQMINKTKSFSGYKFIDYAINSGTIFKILEKILLRIDNLEGRILITVPKIDSTEIFAEKIREFSDKKVMTVHSKNSVDENNEARLNADIIVSTIKSIGQGDDIKGLRVLINFEPIGSWGIVHQLRGRLREYSKDKDTYLFYPIDISIPKLMSMYRRIRTDFEKGCKEVVEMTMYDV